MGQPEGHWPDPACGQTFTVAHAHTLAQAAHADQRDAQGRPYYQAHLLPCALAAASHGEHAVMAAVLHDIVEDQAPDPDTGLRWLTQRGVPADVVDAIAAVTRLPGEPYLALIVRAAAHPLGRTIKRIDNLRNRDDNADLANVDPARARSLRRRYERAAAILWPER